MQLLTHGQWWSNVWKRGFNLKLSTKYPWTQSVFLPLCSDCIRNSVNILAVDKICMSHTISCEQLCHLFRHSYRVVRGIRLLDLRLAALDLSWIRWSRITLQNHIFWCLPFGITPGSMKVAKVKFARTKNVMTPWYAGTHGWRNM